MTNELLKGYHRFRQNRWPSERAEYEALATNGQKPHTLVVACSDSRADPALIFDTAPGELFVVRNVANLVPPYEPDGKLHGVSAALEFGVNVLKVQHVVVMGHASCGGVNAMRNGAPSNCQDFVAPWVAQGVPAVSAAIEGV
ncbi:MAG TPA: carbonic anhydrase, partial [Brevundimonas sp.]|nr:carbonic anhydrase [Brevundimonas sp.]